MSGHEYFRRSLSIRAAVRMLSVQVYIFVSIHEKNIFMCAKIKNRKIYVLIVVKAPANFWCHLYVCEVFVILIKQEEL